MVHEKFLAAWRRAVKPGQVTGLSDWISDAVREASSKEAWEVTAVGRKRISLYVDNLLRRDFAKHAMEVASPFRYPAQITEAGEAGPDVEQNDMGAGQGIKALQRHA
nr:hypothetical protein [Acetobacter sp. UBA5411]